MYDSFPKPLFMTRAGDEALIAWLAWSRCIASGATRR